MRLVALLCAASAFVARPPAPRLAHFHRGAAADDLDDLPRRELQGRAREAGVRANAKSVVIIAQLRALVQ